MGEAEWSDIRGRQNQFHPLYETGRKGRYPSALVRRYDDTTLGEY
jgi:hypothetical protein